MGRRWIPEIYPTIAGVYPGKSDQKKYEYDPKRQNRTTAQGVWEQVNRRMERGDFGAPNPPSSDFGTASHDESK